MSRTIRVGQRGDVDAVSLTAALASASPGDTLALSAGVYEESVQITVDVTLVAAPVAEGESSGDVVRPTVKGAITTYATVRLEGIEVQGPVNVRAGHTILEQCDLCRGSDGVRAHPGSRADVRSCRVHHCSMGGDGVYYMSGSSGEVVDTDIYDCRVHGIHIQGSDITVRDNRLRDCAFGVYYEKSGGGSCTGNTIEHMARFGILVADASSPVISGNIVRECGVLCLYVSTGGRGQCTQNTFDGSVHVLANCPVQLFANQVSGATDIDVAGFSGIPAN